MESRLRRYCVPLVALLLAGAVCGKLLLSPVETTYSETSSSKSSGLANAFQTPSLTWSSVTTTWQAWENGWPWVFSKWDDGDLLQLAPVKTAPRNLTFSLGLLLADVALLAAVLTSITVLFHWLWRRRQYRLQFTIRDILIVTTLVAAFIAWHTHYARQWSEEDEHIARLAEKSIRVDKSADETPAILQRLWPIEHEGEFRRALALNVRNYVGVDYGAELQFRLPHLRAVRSLLIEHDRPMRLNDPAAFCFIEEIEFSNRGADDDTLKSLSQLRRLARLSLTYCPITDRGLAYLADCHTLECLNLSKTRITAAGICRLTGLPRLRELDISGHKLDPAMEEAVFDTLLQLRSLEKLNISCHGITARGVRRVLELPHLQELVLPRHADTPEETLQLLRQRLKRVEVDITSGTL